MQKNNNPAHCDCKEIQNNYKELQEEMTAKDASVYKIVRKMNTKSQKKNYCRMTLKSCMMAY